MMVCARASFLFGLLVVACSDPVTAPKDLAVGAVAGPGGGSGVVDVDSGARANVDAGASPELPPASSFPKAFDEGATYATTRYVGPNGNDESGAGTTAAPFRTVRRALQGSGPGTDVVLLPGTHPAPLHLGTVQGEPNAPIRIRGLAGAEIDGMANTATLGISNPRWLVLEDLLIRDSSIHGMNIDDGGDGTAGEGVVLRNVTIRNAGSGGNVDCLKLSGIDNFYIVGSDFSGCNAGEAIDMVGCHDGLITNNRFHDTSGTGVQAKGGSKNVVIHGNVFRNIALNAINLGGGTGDAFVRPPNAPYEGERLIAISNVIIGSRQSAVNFQGCGECVAANNTIVDPERWIVRILPGSRDSGIVPTRQGFFVNNIIRYQSADVRSITNVGPDTEPATFVFSHNLYFAQGGQGFNGIHGGQVPDEVSSQLQVEPGFVNAAQDDFSLVPTSPARGAGRPLPWGTLFTADRQLPNTPPDLGAFRFE